MFVVISYDISNNRRRLKVSRLLENFGGARVQLSVFECHLEAAHWPRLQKRLQQLIKNDEDSVRFYVLCENCQGRITYLGLAQPTPEPGLRII